MNNPTLAKKYLRRFATGGDTAVTDVDNQAKFSGAASTVAGVGNGLLDAFDSPNEYGHQSVGTTAAKSALSFGAAGASVGGPVGAGIGAALGLGVGLFNGIKAKRQETGMRAQKFTTMQTNEMNRSSAAIASDPNLVTGYKNAQMFAGGGQLPTATVTGHPDPATRTYFDNLKKQDFSSYQALTQVGRKHGFMKVGDDYSTSDIGIKKANYNPLTNTANLAYPNASSYLHELPHKIQADRDGTLLFEGKFIRDKIKYWGHNPYSKKDTVEHEAHSIIQPKIMEEYNQLYANYSQQKEYASGGTMSSTPVPNVSPDKSFDSIPDYLYYLKAVQSGNEDAANKMVGHLTGLRGQDTVSRLQFLGKDMKTSNVFDLAKRNIAGEKDPEMHKLYRQLNENPDLFNKFQFSMDEKPLVTRANGGSLKAPLAQAYMNGGNARSLSSDTTELQGNSHAEGGIEIPQVGAEVEGGETTADNFVFSKQLGFAQLHKPIAKAKGIIEKKPQTAERVNAMKLLNKQENKLALSQEYLKQRMGIR